MKKKLPLFILIALLALAATLLIVWRLSSSNQKTKLLPSPTPLPDQVHFEITTTPIITITPITKQVGQGDQPEELIESLEKKFPLFRHLPYETKKYLVDYQTAFHLRVRLKTDEDQKIIEEEIKTWIRSKEIDPDTHQITFIPAP